MWLDIVLILVEAVAGHLVTITESVTMVKMRIHALPIVVATMMEYVKLDEEKTNIHVSMIADVIPTQYVNLSEEKPLVPVKTVPVVVEVVKHQVVIQILVKEEGHGIGQHLVVNLLNQVVILHEALSGLERNAHVLLAKLKNMDGVGGSDKKIVLELQEALLGTECNVYAQVK